jgi:hypothetical protein
LFHHDALVRAGHGSGACSTKAGNYATASPMMWKVKDSRRILPGLRRLARGH